VTTVALPSARRVQFTYLLLTLLSTLAASFIWGINTLFLLDAGLSNTAAFTANAFFAVGQLVFEVPTGVVADVWGRRTSFLLGCATLLVSTLLYLYMWDVQAGMLGWALASILLGLGFTFFSGAVEAWLVDALNATGFTGRLESVFGRGQAVSGAATLIGSVAGGIHRPRDQPRCALHLESGGPRHHPRGGLLSDAGPGILPAARRKGL
jgi:MFS family permease